MNNPFETVLTDLLRVVLPLSMGTFTLKVDFSKNDTFA